MTVRITRFTNLFTCAGVEAVLNKRILIRDKLPSAPAAETSWCLRSYFVRKLILVLNNIEDLYRNLGRRAARREKAKNMDTIVCAH